MALQGVLSADKSSVGVEFPTAYARVQNYTGDKDAVIIVVTCHANEQARVEGRQPVSQVEYVMPVPPIDGALLPAMYAFLKTLPDFAGYVDV